jgi:hypothetical protein
LQHQFLPLQLSFPDHFISSLSSSSIPSFPIFKKKHIPGQ